MSALACLLPHQRLATDEAMLQGMITASAPVLLKEAQTTRKGPWLTRSGTINKKRGPVLLKVAESIRKGSEIQADYESQSMACGQEMPATNCDENRAHGLLGQVPHKIA